MTEATDYVAEALRRVQVRVAAGKMKEGEAIQELVLVILKQQRQLDLLRNQVTGIKSRESLRGQI